MNPNDSSAPKSYVFGAYEIVDTAGTGGMGVVYRAVDRALGRTVALKVLRDDLRAHPVLVARFQREAETFATLNHPNIVHIYSVGCIGRIPFIAMEYVEGPALSDVLQERGPLPWREALDVAAQVASALSCAHDAQIIHRDVKPANILIDKNGRALVTDFGIAKVLSAETQLTADGSRLGTPQYLCPERCQDQEITPASDVYSLGVVLFQCLTGKMPYEALSSVEFIEKIIGEAPARVRDFVPSIPEPVDRLVAFMLEKDPLKRPGDGRALGEAIDRVRRGLPLDDHVDELSMAIADFRRSLATPTPRGKTPATKTPPKKSSKQRIEKRWFALSRRVRLLLAGVIVIGLMAGAAVLTFRALGGAPLRETPLGPDNGIARWALEPRPLAEFRNETDRVRLAHIQFDAMTPSRIFWAGASWGTIIRFDGDPGSARAGQSALIALDPETQKTLVLFEPFYCDGDWRLLDVRRESNGGLSVFLSTPASTLAWSSVRDTLPVMIADTGSSALCPHPGGERIALAFGGLTQAQWVVRETTVALPENKPPVTPPGAPIEALAYSGDGASLAYLRRLPSGAGELWMKSLGEAESAGAQLAENCVRMDKYPFQPAGNGLLAICRSGGNASELTLFAASGRNASQSLGPGACGAWAPDGKTAVAAAPDPAGRNQLWQVPVEAPDSRTQLTYLGSGVQPAVSVSEDGRYAISARADGSDIVIVLLGGGV